MAYKPSPRPTFDAPTVIRADDAIRHVWGDDEAGLVDDWIYVSSERIHTIVFGLPAAGAFRHSESFRTVFAADELLYVLQGTLVLANPETGEVVRAETGESVFFRRDTWHHGFSYGRDELRVLEYFAPPPSTGSSGPYARTRPYIRENKYANEHHIGSVVGAANTPSFQVMRANEATWRLDRGVLIGLLASTEHLTVGNLRLLPGQTSIEECHEGDELVYTVSGSMRVLAEGVDTVLDAGDAFFVPAGVAHRYAAVGSTLGDAIFGVAPKY
jgi:quercetin dioxygenase-like cupin family protein